MNKDKTGRKHGKTTKEPNLRISIGAVKGSKFGFTKKSGYETIESLLAEARRALARKEVSEVILVK